MAIRGMRVDPGQCYGMYDGTAATAKGIVRECHDMGVDALFVIPYSYEFGAFYPAHAPHTWVEPGFGRDDFMSRLMDAAQAVEMRVIGSFWLNRYNPARTHNASLIQTFASWGAKRQDGQPYQTANSAWSPGFRAWFREMLSEFIDLVPGLNGLEAWEGVVAFSGETGPGAPDFAQGSRQAFAARHPGQPMTGDVWQDHLAEGMTGLHRILFRTAHEIAGGRSFFVQDLAWDFNHNTLMQFRDYARFCGTDFRALSAPTADPADRADFGILEAIWQQRATDFPGRGFDPDWTGTAVREFASRLATLGGAKPMGHVEVTPAPVGHPTVIPTPGQLETALRHAFTGTSGATVYDFTQVRKNPGYVQAVRNVYGA